MVKKVELHCHLEGTATPKLITKIAKRNHLAIPKKLFSQNNDFFCWSTFPDFLQTYDLASGILKTPEDYYDITFDYLKRSHFEDVIYTELIYSPAHAKSTEHLSATADAIHHAYDSFGIQANLIFVGIRSLGVSVVEKTAKLASQRPIPEVVGFDLAGDEINFPPGQFKRAYDIAHEAGLGLAAHAGEFIGPDVMREAIDKLHLKRVHHGVRAIEDAALMQYLKDGNIHLALCPSSNIALGLFPNFQNHPFKTFFDFGLSISLNSDDPPYFKTTIGNEYAIAKQHFLLSDSDLTFVSRMAIDAAFACQEQKLKLHQQLLT